MKQIQYVSIIFTFIFSSHILGIEEKENHQEWIKNFKTKNRHYKDNIPKSLVKEIQRNYPNFSPLTFQDTKTEASDYNCDGKPDYAIVGLTKEDNSLLTKPVLSKVSLEDLQQEFHKYKYDKGATVLIALSSKEGKYLWLKRKGSYASSGGTELPCSNTNKKAKEVSKFLKENKCQYLYTGCCEKDGSYEVWKKDSKEILHSGGC